MTLETPNNTEQASSMRQLQEAADASFLAFGDAETETPKGGNPIELVETFGAYEAEYSAIRKSAALLDMPHRGLISLTGNDRVQFLQNLISQDVAKLPTGQLAHSFLLNGKGRIIADMTILASKDTLYLELDRIDVTDVLKVLDQYLFTEDVTLTDLSDQYHLLGAFGPQAPKLLELSADATDDKAPGNHYGDLADGHHAAIYIEGTCCSVYRHDLTGSPSYFIWVKENIAADTYQAMADALGGLNPATDQRQRPIRGRGIGWLAFNTARIEAGSPLYHIDYGPDSIPQETELLDQYVNFTKGCYIGQEIVARMFNLGHPKRVLVGLDIETGELPIAGSPVFKPYQNSKDNGDSPDTGAEEMTIIGGITSSSMTPLLSGHALALATMKWGEHKQDSIVEVPAEGGRVSARVVSLKTLQDGMIVKR